MLDPAVKPQDDLGVYLKDHKQALRQQGMGLYHCE